MNDNMLGNMQADVVGDLSEIFGVSIIYRFRLLFRLRMTSFPSSVRQLSVSWTTSGQSPSQTRTSLHLLSLRSLVGVNCHSCLYEIRTILPI